MEEIKRLNRELVHKGSILNIYKDTMKFPNGNVENWDFVEHKGAAAMVAVLEDGRILMVRQQRPALERFTLEIPAGALNYKEEPTKICALRELEEETGYKAEDCELLVSLYSTVAFCNEKIDVYLARNLTRSHQNLDENEFVEIVPSRVEDLLELIYAGKMQDAKTVAAILAYYARFGK